MLGILRTRQARLDVTHADIASAAWARPYLGEATRGGGTLNPVQVVPLCHVDRSMHLMDAPDLPMAHGRAGARAGAMCDPQGLR
jgi:hypothetical protein